MTKRQVRPLTPTEISAKLNQLKRAASWLERAGTEEIHTEVESLIANASTAIDMAIEILDTELERLADS